MKKREIKHIVIHCTGASQNQSVESIQNYWRNNLGWKSPGYHILIEPDGTKNYLMSFDKATNGVKGFNSNSIHICYIGGVDGKDERTEAQRAGIIESIHMAMEYCNGQKNKPEILGHYQFPNVPKTCPNFDAKNEYSWITA